MGFGFRGRAPGGEDVGRLQPAEAQGALVFESEALENVPAGWKARESYRVASPDEFVETFEIATDGKTFSVYSQTRFRRVRRP